jgi:histidinol-phosphate aminotransferase
VSFNEEIERKLQNLSIIGPYKKHLLGLQPKINLADNLNHHFCEDVYPPFESALLKEAYIKTLMEYSPNLSFLDEKLEYDFDVFFINGALAGTEQILHTFCRESEKVLTFSPTFPFYKDICLRKYLDFKEIPLEGEDLTDLNVKAADSFTPKVIILCDPNNPIGTRFKPKHIEEILIHFKNSLIIIDETYVEFSKNSSNLRFLKDYQNLLVIRGLSKGWGMASLRLCAIFGAKNIVECLKRYCVAYPVSFLSIQAAISKFTYEKEVAMSSWKTTRAERDRVFEFLEKEPIISKIYPSETNFICFSCDKYKEIKEYLFQNGILIEDVSHIIPSSLRVTIGTKPENKSFLATFSKISRKLISDQ